MASSSAYLHAVTSYQQNHVLLNPSKDFHVVTLCSLRVKKFSDVHLKSNLVGQDSWKANSWFVESDKYIKLDSNIGRPSLFDFQGTVADTFSESGSLSSFVSGSCIQEKPIPRFLLPEFTEAETDGLDFSVVADLMGTNRLTVGHKPQALTLQDEVYRLYGDKFDGSQSSLACPHSLFYPRRELFAPKPLLDLIGELASTSKIMTHPDGRVLFTGTGAEMRDLLSVVAEFYLSKKSTTLRKQMLIPQFTRLDTIEASTNVLSQLGAVKASPLKSSVKIKMKPLRRKAIKKVGRGRDIYRKSYFHTCESFLSLMVSKKKGKLAVLTLQKSGSELPQLLTQFSTGIAGTGLAVLFSVVCKVGSGRVPFCSSKMLNTILGFGLVWLSSSVSKLNDSVLHICKNSSKLNIEEEEVLMKKVDKSVNDIYFRAATLVVVVILGIV